MNWTTIQSGGLSRRYIDYIPANLDPDKPVLIALHGGGGSPTGFAGQAGLRDIADQHGIRVIVPEGMHETWNVGDGQGRAERRGVDDVQFIADLIAREGAGDNALLVGMSKGGMLSYKVASEVPSINMDIGVIAATMIDQANTMLVGPRVVHIHGSLDDRVPVDGDGTDRRPAVVSGIMEFADDNLNQHDFWRRETENVEDGKIIRVRSTKDGKVYATYYEVSDGGHELDVSASINEVEFILSELGFI